MATGTIYAGAGDGMVLGGSNSSWSAGRTAGATGANYTAAQNWMCYGSSNAGDTYTYTIYRSWYPFYIDPSIIPAGSTVTAATFDVWPAAASVYSGAGGAACVVRGTQASYSQITNSDYTAYNTTELVTRINFSSMTANAYNSFTLNSSGLALIVPGQTLSLCLRTSFDVDNSAPNAYTYSGFYGNQSEQTGTANDPRLVITFTAPSAKPTKISLKPALFKSSANNILGGFGNMRQ